MYLFPAEGTEVPFLQRFRLGTSQIQSPKRKRGSKLFPRLRFGLKRRARKDPATETGTSEPFPPFVRAIVLSCSLKPFCP
jgi:hypothetical protein